MLHAPQRGAPHQTLLPGGRRGKGQELKAPVSFGTRTRPPATMEKSIFLPRRPRQGTQALSLWSSPGARGAFGERAARRTVPAGDGQALGVLPKGAVVAASQMALSDPDPGTHALV